MDPVALLGTLRQLDPDLTDAVTGENPDLARATALYPLGHDTDPGRPVEPLSAEALDQWKRDWTGFALDSRFFRIEDEQKNDYRDSFAHALRAFAHDVRSNAEPRECWPSAEHFRTILYAAGRHEGASAARLIDRISDPALRCCLSPSTDSVFWTRSIVVVSTLIGCWFFARETRATGLNGITGRSSPRY